MRSTFWTFVEACDDAHSLRAVKDLTSAAVRSLGFDTFALLTHAPRDDVASLGVVVHTWKKEAIDHLFAPRPASRPNAIFEAVEGSEAPLHWSSRDWQALLGREQRDWLSRFRQLVGGYGVTRAMRSTVVNASCSLVSPQLLEPDRIRTGMRIANYAFHQIQFLQRPQLSEPEKLTAREHERLYRAAVFGERPSLVAGRLGVKVSTVRTLRQKAYGRLDADSPEQAVWRMMETGQLFRSGRKNKPRTS